MVADCWSTHLWQRQSMMSKSKMAAGIDPNRCDCMAPVCPFCGSSNFSIVQDVRESVVITPSANVKLIAVERKREDVVRYEWIYCEICGQRVARRSDWAAKGIEVPE